MWRIKQKVKCGGQDYEIVEISKTPYLKFDDGSLHYVMSLELCNGDWRDWLIVNDAQLDR